MLNKFVRNRVNNHVTAIIGLTHDEAWRLIEDKELILEFKSGEMEIIIYAEPTEDEIDSTFVKMFGDNLAETKDN